MTIFEACLAALAVDPWQTAAALAAVIGTSRSNVSGVMLRDCGRRYARVRRELNRRGVWEYALYQTPSKPARPWPA